MAGMYLVVGQCAHVRTASPSGPITRLLHKGALLPADVPPDQIRHLLSVKLISTLPGSQQRPPVSMSTVAPEPEPEPAVTPAADDLPEERLAAQAKLTPGKLPHHNAAEAVWVEAAVRAGYDYEQCRTAGKAELVKLLKG